MSSSVSGLPVIHIAGHWMGEPNTTRRYFSGRVTASDHPQVLEQEHVIVLYQCPEARVVPCDVHGRYILKWHGLVYPLVSFLCEAMHHPGHSRRQQEGGATHWTALAIPEGPGAGELAQRSRVQQSRLPGR